MIIFLNGSINSGKSTAARLLAKALPNTALVEIDTLREMIDWMPIAESIPLNLKNAVSVIANFVEEGLNVVVPYPLSEKNHDYMMCGLKSLDIQIHVFTLDPGLERALTNRGTRELDEWEKGRIQYHYDVGIHNPSFGKIVDTANQTPEQTSQHILSQLDERGY